MQANPGQDESAYEVAHQDGWAKYQKVMPSLLGGDQLVNNAPRTAKAAMERAPAPALQLKQPQRWGSTASLQLYE
ncbi:hypothetical protein [Paraburkholderia strydomiana]|uniref:hypothetical protein n=1 Tax=Paraburkholderia strydomiana TaxID=1245417 RepID=UPI002856648D|nr:hypothetical protein [Paraburkholderia strydomiana]MDR7006644.1 hypothetical protein [Paraburkholderia strydomiana]